MRRKIFILRYLIILILFFFLDNCKNKNQDSVLIQVNDYIITCSKFEDLYKNSLYKFSKEEILDDFISTGLLYKRAEKFGYLDDTEVNKILLRYKDSLAIKYFIQEAAKVQAISNHEILKSYKRFQNKQYIIDYVWVPNKQKEIVDSLYQFIEAGFSVDEIKTFKNKGISNFHQNGIQFFGNLIVTPGRFIDKIEKKILKLKNNEITLIKTLSGYHIIKLLDEVINKQQFNDIKEGIQIRLAIAKQFESGNFMLDCNYLNNKIKINWNAIASASFITDPMCYSSDTDIIASFKDHNYSIETLNNKISSLPINIQALFKNHFTRSRAVATLIMIENCCKPLLFKGEEMLLAYKDKLNIQSAIDYYLNKVSNIGDSIKALTYWFNSLLGGSGSNKLYYLIKDEAALLALDKGKFISNKEAVFKKKFQDLFKYNSTPEDIYLHPERFSDIHLLKINYSNLEKKQIEDIKYPKDSEIIAYDANWSLSVGELKQILEELAPQTRIDIAKDNNSINLVKYIAKNYGNVNNINSIKINTKLLEGIDIIGNSIDLLNYYPLENDTIAWLDNVNISLKELRNIITGLPEQQKKEFMYIKNIKNKVKEILIQKFYLSKLNFNELEKLTSFKNEFKDLTACLLITNLMDNEIYVRPINTTDERLNYLLRIVLKNINNERINYYLKEAAKNTCIKVNKVLLNQIGIDIKKSKYYNVIQIIN